VVVEVVVAQKVVRLAIFVQALVLVLVEID
jgi:hypothetical protein